MEILPSTFLDQHRRLALPVWGPRPLSRVCGGGRRGGGVAAAFFVRGLVLPACALEVWRGFVSSWFSGLGGRSVGGVRWPGHRSVWFALARPGGRGWLSLGFAVALPSLSAALVGVAAGVGSVGVGRRGCRPFFFVRGLVVPACASEVRCGCCRFCWFSFLAV